MALWWSICGGVDRESPYSSLSLQIKTIICIIARNDNGAWWLFQNKKTTLYWNVFTRGGLWENNDMIEISLLLHVVETPHCALAWVCDFISAMI